MENKKQWIVDEDGNFCNVKCSACGMEYACHYGMLQLQNFDYCPNCGTKMDGKSNVVRENAPKVYEIDFDYEAED
jgi:NAD-dependent SIR2 family protein deacetylase